MKTLEVKVLEIIIITVLQVFPIHLNTYDKGLRALQIFFTLTVR